MSMTKKCPICKKSVYPNDAKLVIADGTYHKSCAKCKVCNCQLTIRNFSTSGDDLMCKTHFMEAFARSGGSYGGDDKFKHSSTRAEQTKKVAPVASTSTAPAPTAAKAVPVAPEPAPTPAPKVEKEPAKVVPPPAPAAAKPKGKHKSKLSGFLDNQNTAATAAAPVVTTEPKAEAEFSCKPAADPVKPSEAAVPSKPATAAVSKPAATKPKKKIPKFGGGASKKCPICKKTIYPNDPKLSMGGNVYHKSCSKCEVCGGQLNIKNFATSGDRLLCKTHFMEEFASSGGSYGGDEKFKHASRGN